MNYEDEMYGDSLDDHHAAGAAEAAAEDALGWDEDEDVAGADFDWSSYDGRDAE